MNNFLDGKIIKKFIPIFIFLFAFALRVYGINWDQNQHLHPDERFLTMTVGSMRLPKTFSEFFDPSVSKLNPYNINTGFFVYGTLPTTLAKYLSVYDYFDSFQYDNITLTGRLLSAVFDVGVVILIYFIASKIFSKKTGWLAAFLYSISVLPIQLSHFFAVDTFLNFFLVLSFYFVIKLINGKKIYFSLLLGISYGAAIACKISALYFLPIIILAVLYFAVKQKGIRLIVYPFLIFIFASYISIRIFDNHIFLGNLLNPKISPQFIQNIKELKSQGTKDSLFPPAIQWLSITPIIFPLKNIMFWGLGPILGVLSIFAVFHSIFSIIREVLKKIRLDKNLLKNLIKIFSPEKFSFLLIIFWVVFLFFYQAIQYTPSMRYFLPIYPFLAILSANFLYQCINTLTRKICNRTLLTLFYSSTLLFLLIWPISFLHIYSRPHSRVLASKWIYKNIQTGSVLSCDSWDDCLPLSIDKVGVMSQYKILTMEPFAPDTFQKQLNFKEQLQHVDYIVLSSNRAWGSLSKLPDKFPYMSEFYENLFSGKLNFTKVAEITSYPTIPIFNVPIPDQSSEEAFTVYDHPEVLIFKRN